MSRLQKVFLQASFNVPSTYFTFHAALASVKALAMFLKIP